MRESTVENVSYIQAVNRALEWSLEQYDSTFIIGEDIGSPGGPFGATKNLHKNYGAKRVIDTPISEGAFIGMSLGSAMTGLRPIAEIMYADFMFVALDQVINQIANSRYSSAGRWAAPLVIRTQQGYNPGSCAQHSHSIEAYLAHTPGIRIAIPSTADDAYQMIRTSVESDDPVLVLEARSLYPMKGPVNFDSPVQKMGGAKIRREGADVTVVSWSRMVSESLDAAEILAEQGIDVEVVDIRWISPLDFDTVWNSVAKTGRLAIAHEANVAGGFGAEIAARAAAECLSHLKAPIVRVGAPNVPVPAAPSLQAVVIPGVKDVVNAVRLMYS